MFRYLFEILENERLIYRRLDVWVQYPVSPQNSKDKKDSKYDKSRKIKVLRDFLFLFSDIYQ